MKNKIKRATICLSIFLILIESNEQLTAAEELRCITFYSTTNGVNSTISHIAQSMLENLDKEEQISASVYYLEEEFYDSLEYKIKTAEALDMDVMILSDIKGEIDEALSDKLKTMGLYIMIVDGEALDYKMSACIGTANREAGERAASMIAEQKGEYKIGILAMFRDGKLSSSRRERYDGFLEKVEEYENLQVYELCKCSLDTLESIETVKKYLTEHPDINVLYCLDATSGVVASKVLSEQEITDDIYVICFDKTEQVEEEMKQGGIDMVFIQDTEEVGAICADFLKKMAKTEERESFFNVNISVPCQCIVYDMLEEMVDEE